MKAHIINFLACLPMFFSGYSQTSKEKISDTSLIGIFSAETSYYLWCECIDYDSYILNLKENHTFVLRHAENRLRIDRSGTWQLEEDSLLLEYDTGQMDAIQKRQPRSVGLKILNRDSLFVTFDGFQQWILVRQKPQDTLSNEKQEQFEFRRRQDTLQNTIFGYYKLKKKNGIFSDLQLNADSTFCFSQNDRSKTFKECDGYWHVLGDMLYLQCPYAEHLPKDLHDWSPYLLGRQLKFKILKDKSLRGVIFITPNRTVNRTYKKEYSTARFRVECLKTELNL